MSNIAITVKKQVTLAPSALEGCKNKEAIVIATEWKEFRDIDWQTVYDNMNKPAFVFDGRLILDADKLRKIGFNVSAVFKLTYKLPHLRMFVTRSLSSAAAARKILDRFFSVLGLASLSFSMDSNTNEKYNRQIIYGC